jgi:hypothetical protein
MKVLGLLKADESSERGDMPSPELMQKMGELMTEVTQAGVLLATEGLQPSAHGKRISFANGKATVTDGPFTESKELIASYALFQVKDWDEAIYWTQRFLEVLGQGECELRPIFEFDAFPADVFPPEAVAQEAEVRRQMEQNAGRQA